METIAAGDYVRLLPRERPFIDEPHWWWKVIAVDDISFDALYVPLQIIRRGVAFSSIAGHRTPDRPEAA